MFSQDTINDSPSEPAQAAALSLPTIAGYEVLSVLGRGGMGRVYLARQRALGRLVAVKMLLDASDEMLIARFQAESQAVARLQHPNIAQVFETGQLDGQPYLVLEYVEGGSLAQKLAGKPIAPQEAARMVEVLARAIEHSHQNHILHRDLKPANILLATDGTPKITDFGLAKRLNESSKLTRTGEILGTPCYMAPEQASGMVPTAGPGVDLYALGAILYEMLTGRPPFQGPDSLQTVMMVLTMDPVPPRRLLPGVPRDLETICLKCLEKTPRKRYASAIALAEDLRRFQDGQPILARPVRWWERAFKWGKRRPWAAAFLGLLFAAVAGLAASSVQIYSTNRQLEASNREIRASLWLARHAIDGMLVELAEELAPTPQSDELRRKSLEKARELYERLVAIRPGDRDGRTQAADALGKLGKIYGDLGRLDDAEATYRRALQMHEGLKAEEPDSVDHRRGAAHMLLNIANLERTRGHPKQSEELASAALAQLEPLLVNPEVGTLEGASAIYNTLALVRRANGKPREADQAHEAALKLRQDWLRQDPASTDAKVAVAASLSNKATLLLARDPATAVKAFTEAEQLLSGPTSPRLRAYVGQFQANRALGYEQLRMDKEAELTHAAAIKTLEALVADFSAVPRYRHLLAKEHLNCAAFFGPRFRTEEGVRHARIAGPMYQALVKESPNNREFRIERDRWQAISKLLEEDLADLKKRKS